MILSLIIGIPVLGAILVGLFPQEKVTKFLSLLASVITFIYSLNLWLHFDQANSSFQFKELWDLVPSLGIHYSLGLDGLQRIHPALDKSWEQRAAGTAAVMRYLSAVAVDQVEEFLFLRGKESVEAGRRDQRPTLTAEIITAMN